MCIKTLLMEVQKEYEEAYKQIHLNHVGKAEACLNHAQVIINQYFERKGKNAEPEEVDSS